MIPPEDDAATMHTGVRYVDYHSFSAGKVPSDPLDAPIVSAGLDPVFAGEPVFSSTLLVTIVHYGTGFHPSRPRTDPDVRQQRTRPILRQSITSEIKIAGHLQTLRSTRLTL